MNRQRVVPPLFRGPDGQRVSPEREREIRAAVAAEKARRCDGEVFNRYENGGAGGMVPCRKKPEAGSSLCRWHKERKA